MLLHVALNTLIVWDKGLDGDLAPYALEDCRGKACKVDSELVGQVVEAARQITKEGRRLRIKDFVKHLREHLGLDIGRSTVERILIANDLRYPHTRQKRPRYYQSLRREVPNGLVSVDGSQMVVHLGNREIRFNVELAVDVTSFCHTGLSVTSTETTDAVIEVLEQHRRHWGTPLGVVFDHGSANLSDRALDYLSGHQIEIVPAGPANPKGNGTDEGAFSQMKQVLGSIRLDDSSPWALARSVLELVAGVYIRMRNRSRVHKRPVFPEEHMKDPVDPGRLESERRHLQAFNAARKDKTSETEKLQRLQWIVKHHRLTPELAALERARKTIRYYELDSVEQAEAAFVKAVARDDKRRNLSYFFGILKNIQQQRDEESYRQYCRQRYNYEMMQKMERLQREHEIQQQVPTAEIIAEMAAKAVTARARFCRELAMRKVSEWVSQLLDTVSYVQPVWKRMAAAVAGLKELSVEQREKVLELIEGVLPPKTMEESVTFNR